MNRRDRVQQPARAPCATASPGRRMAFRRIVRGFAKCRRRSGLRERLQKYGPAALATAELIAIIWRSGTKRQNVLTLATHALAQYGCAAPVGAGFGRGTGATARCRAGQGGGITGGFRTGPAADDDAAGGAHGGALARGHRQPADAGDGRLRAGASARGAARHQAARVAAIREIYIGSLNASPIRVGELFRDAIRQSSAAIIVVHNHPQRRPHAVAGRTCR